MRSCKYSPLLVQYLKDELPLEDRERVSNHLQHCASCRQEMVLHRKLSSLFAPSAERPVPADVESRTLAIVFEEMDRVARKAPQPREIDYFRPFFSGRFVTVGMAAAVILTCLSLIWYFLLPPEPVRHSLTFEEPYVAEYGVNTSEYLLSLPGGKERDLNELQEVLSSLQTRSVEFRAGRNRLVQTIDYSIPDVSAHSSTSLVVEMSGS